MSLAGLYPATITPFLPDLSIDSVELERHLRRTAQTPGVNGIAVNGGLGELLQLSVDEQVDVVRLARNVCAPNQLVIAGLEGRNAEQLIATGHRLIDAGADAFLVLPVFDVRAYRRMSTDTEAVVELFTALDAGLQTPMVVFNYPPASGCAYDVKTMLALARIKNVVAMKAASGTTPVYQELWDALHDKISVLVALDSPPLLEMLEHGSHGALIGISAIAPAVWVDLLDRVQQGDRAGARFLFDKVCRPLMKAVFENQQPVRRTSEVAATKEALVQLGEISSSRVRPPAIGVTQAVREEIRTALISAELLSTAAVPA
ncbi:MAG: dihydrodipicolinate synthase family protein [Hydrogenophaga sp.]|nr:dihydrodipicolinate synthase family protein [Hydrogenophaga sp.]